MQKKKQVIDSHNQIIRFVVMHSDTFNGALVIGVVILFIVVMIQGE